VEVQIKELIAKSSADGHLTLDFDGLHYFGTPEETKVIYMKLKEDSVQYELL